MLIGEPESQQSATQVTQATSSGVEGGRIGDQEGKGYSGGHSHRSPVPGSGSLRARNRHSWPLLVEGLEDKPLDHIVPYPWDHQGPGEGSIHTTWRLEAHRTGTYHL